MQRHDISRLPGVDGDKPAKKTFKDPTKDDLREVQLIYQMADLAMNPRQTVGTIIVRPLQFYFGLSGKVRRIRVQELLDQIEMGTGYIDRYQAELSGGKSSGSVSPAPLRPSRV